MKRLLAWLRLLRMNRRWKQNVRKNRARHTDLIEDEKKGADRTVVAQRMMVRDRDKIRASLERGELRFPDQWDYFMPTTRLEMRVARKRRAARERDVRDLRAQLQAAQ